MKSPLFSSVGVLRYSVSEPGSYKLVVEADQGISDFYRSLIPKWITTNRQLYGAHISVVRKEVPPLVDNWAKHDGTEVEFCYSPTIHRGTVYWWLNCFCQRLEHIRTELGLAVDSIYTRPPEGFAKCFHLTLANTKGL
jgi:hypothetical protein